MRQSTTIKHEPRLIAEWNYNKFAGLNSKTGEVIMYKAPQDTAEHPMYVDGEGRMVPVHATTLLPMYNASGHVIDKNGVTVPKYRGGGTVHIDDVRVAVTGGEVSVTDENGNPILLNKDGKIVPTNSDGVPFTNGSNVLDEQGNVIGNVSEIFAMAAVRPPASADNYPITTGGAYVPESDLVPYHEDSDLCPIESIVEADRPSRRGIKIARIDDTGMWLTDHYKDGRFYLGDPANPYKYWSSGTESSFAGTDVGGNLITNSAFVNGAGWTYSGMASPVYSGGAAIINVGLLQGLFGTSFDTMPGAGYRFRAQMSSQAVTTINFYVRERPSADAQYNYLPLRLVASEVLPGANTIVAVDHNFNLSDTATRVDFYIGVTRGGTAGNVTIRTPSVIRQAFAIDGVGPRALYDRPVKANKIVIGIDYTMDYNLTADENGEEYFTDREGKPVVYEVRIEKDRGDGLTTWTTIATNPTLSDSGHIVLSYNGTSWIDGNLNTTVFNNYTEVMGVQLIVRGMERPGLHVEVMEISLRLVQDLTDDLIDWTFDFEITDQSFVLPFGKISSNTGSLVLGNYDGKYGNHKYLLDNKGNPTTTVNPLYGLTGAGIDFICEMKTFDVDDEPGEYIRQFTAKSEDFSSEGLEITIPLKDDSVVLQRKTTIPMFFDEVDNMSAVEVITSILDSIGFTSVDVDSIDQTMTVSMSRYWHDGTKTVWEMISEICEDTQIAAYFNEYNVLCFLDNNTLKQRALTEETSLWTTEDELGYSNIELIDLEESVEANKITLGYKEIQQDDPDVLPTMSVLWEPEGTVLLRAQPVVDQIPLPTSTLPQAKFIRLPWKTTETWPWEGVVNIEGELIRYKGKEYYYYGAAGTQIQKYIYNEDERKALDKINPKLAYKNVYTGRLKIAERGVEGTQIKAHNIALTGYELRTHTPGATWVYNTSTTARNSILSFRNAAVGYETMYTAFVGHPQDYRPDYYGTRMRFAPSGYTYGKAGICLGMGTNNSGIFVELATTDAIEKEGRKVNELRIYTRDSNGVIQRRGVGTTMAVEKNKWYNMDVHIGPTTTTGGVGAYDYLIGTVLKVGSKGAAVRTLQNALNLKKYTTPVDGIFGTHTERTLKRFQGANGVAQSGTTTEATWQKLGARIVTGLTSITVMVDGVYLESVDIPDIDLPGGYDGGRYGLFSRGNTHVDFEYLYAVDSMEFPDLDSSNFFDRVNGGFTTNQADMKWTFDTKNRTRWSGKTRPATRVKYTNFFMDDFGPIAHEVREFEVKFKSDTPARASYLYFSNDKQVVCPVYNHDAFGAKFVLANASRQDAVIHGEDVITFGTENSVDQKLMVYGKNILLSDEKKINVRDERAIARRGEVEYSITSNWLQDKGQAEKLGYQIVEAIGGVSDTYSMEVFPDQPVYVGQIISVYAPKKGLGKSGGRYVRFVVTSVSTSFDGTVTKRVGIRQLMTLNDYNFRRMSDILKNNNNNMVYNQYFNILDSNGQIAGFEHGNRLHMMPYADPSGGYSMLITGLADPGVTTGGGNTVRGHKYNTLTGGIDPGTMALTPGHFYLYTITVTAWLPCAIRLYLDGRTTTGSPAGIVNEKMEVFKQGQTKRITISGVLPADRGTEVRPMIGFYRPDTKSYATPMERMLVRDMFYRSSNDPTRIYPNSGYTTLPRP